MNNINNIEDKPAGVDFSAVTKNKRGRKPKSVPESMESPAEPGLTQTPGSVFNLNALRLPQNFGDALGVKKMIMRVPVRKPIKTDFFRTRPGENWRIQMMVLELKVEGEVYVLTPDLWGVIPELAKPVMLHTCIDRQNNVFLVPVPLPGSDGRRNQWHQSLAEVVLMAEGKWVRISANMRIGGYDVLVAEANLAEPEWPEILFSELIEIAFRGRIIDTLEHPVIRQLLGVA